MLLTGFALLFSGLMGGIMAKLYQGSTNPVRFQWLLTFCGGLLFSTAILHLVPEVLAYGHRTENLWLLSGFFLQFILEKFSAGIEHGHLHHEAQHQCDHPLHDENHPHNHPPKDHGATEPIHRLTRQKSVLWLKNARSWGLMISLSIHGLIEGIPLSGLENPGSAALPLMPLLLGIVLHKAPTTFALAALLLRQKASPLMLWGAVLWVACCTPLGLWIGHSLGQTGQDNQEILHALMALATGSFLQIASTILFESSNNHKFNWLQTFGALLGAYLAYFMGH
jgi:zinc transporter ZupT